MSESKFLDAALEYLDLGFKVVILGCKGKMPTTAHTPNGLNDATFDHDVVRGWWTMTPKCNVGAVCGESASGFVVIDIDNKDGVDGYETMRDWEMEHGNMPETVMCCTPTGGYHLYYKVDREVAPSVNKRLGVDIRGDGSLAVLPPSIHPDTLTEYIWETPPDEFEMAWADELVYEFIEFARPYENSDGEPDSFDMPDEVPEGMRDETMYKFACSERAHDRPKHVTMAAALEYNRTCFKPPLPESEVRKKVESAYKHAPGFSDEVRGRVSTDAAKADGAISPRSHVAIANTVMGRFNACFLDGVPAVYDGLMYQTGWDAIERAVLKVRRDATDKARNEVIKYLRLVMPHEKASPPNYIGFANGVLDIDTMDLMSFTPEIRIPNIIPHDWDPNARSDVLDQTIRRIACGDPFVENNLFEFLGLCMYRSCKYAYAAVLLGRKSETASNGKSTYIDLLRNVIGDDNYSVLDLNELSQRFQAANMAGKLANLADDISSEFTRGNNLTMFKKVVAGTEVGTDVKNKVGFKFVPYCTMVLSANKLPKLETPDDGVMRRLFPIRFNAHFTPQDPDFDPEIGEKLRSEECLKAAIVRGVSGLKRVIENKRPTPNAESEKMANDIRVENSNILQWIEDAEITRSDFIDEWTTKGAYDAYSAWCSESGIHNKYGKPQFGIEVCSHFKLETYPTRDVKRRGIRRYRPMAEA